jgi:CubicO group peptidase (beta-lactamase class C family)
LAPSGVIDGYADEGYGRVADVFAEGFASRGEVGAAVAVYVGGRRVVDLWGGVADTRSGRAWTGDTPVPVFSCTKGLLAICAYLLVQQGRLDLDVPVVRYWPEFGHGAKAGIPVRWLLAHRAGLPALDRDLTLDEVLAWQPVIEAIETQAPLWPPGTAHCYHSMTYGWLVGEVIRRITGATPGEYFRRVVGTPLGVSTWIGLPASYQESVAWVRPPPPSEAVSPVAERARTMGGAFPFPTDSSGVVSFNDPRLQLGEIPGAGGISTAAGLARVYAGCVCEIDGPRLLTRASVDDAVVVRSHGQQLFAGPDAGHRWGTGFMLGSPPIRPMLGKRSFGHDGAGGHLAFADDEHQVGFGYVTNTMGGPDDDRANQLTSAVQHCLHG